MIDVARIKKRKYFAEAEYNVKLKKTDVVEELLEFGILYRQPMAIYMGEKLAMMTGQTIPHKLAMRVSDMFSHYR